MSANATCIEGTAANGLNSAPAGPLGSTPVNSATESENPSPGMRRGGAVGNAT